MADTVMTRKEFRRRILLVLVSVSTLSLFGCGGTTLYLPPAVEGQYPSATYNLYFMEPYNGYGGHFGLPGFELGQEDAWWLGSMPGFEIYQGHHGGVGDTLQVVSYTNGIYLGWAWDMLWVISCFEGWQGQIEAENKQMTGIRLGSSASDFLAKYPSAVKQVTQWGSFRGNSYRVSFRTDRHLTADCDANDIIRRLRVDTLRPSDFGYNGPS